MNNKYITTDKLDITYCSLDSLLEKIHDAINRYGKENVHFEVEDEYGYGDAFSTKAFLSCKREMDEKEKAVAIEKENHSKLQREKWERQQYEALKKKFEAKS
jgi:hypothetical protein